MKIKQLTRSNLLISSIFLGLVLFHLNAFSQNSNNHRLLTKEVKANLVDKIAKILKDSYVLPAEGKLMSDYIKACLKNNYYDKISDPSQFADSLTAGLQSVCNDKHLSINYDPEAEKTFDEGLGNNNPDKEYSDEMKKDNYGFKKVERLSGNIGYIDIRSFSPPEESKETVASVMEFLSNSDAVIIDLRKNGGGSPYGVQLFCSYFFGTQPVHLNDIYSRDNSREEYWTIPDIAGKRMPDMPLYILTGSYTFSAAEEFAYDLKVLKRATIIGESTRGGANSGGVASLGSGFVMFVPKGRAVNPETKTNWEGEGVQPDLPIASDKALEQAEILALRQISDNTANEKEKLHLKWMTESLEGALNQPELSEAQLKIYVGNYEDRKVTLENGSLYYQRNRNAKFRMTPMTDDMFMFDELESFRIIFLKDSKGKVTGLLGIYDDGHADKSKRTN